MLFLALSVANAQFPKELLPETSFSIVDETSDGYSMQGSYKVVQNSDQSDLYGLRDATVHFKTTITVPGGLKEFDYYSSYI